MRDMSFSSLQDSFCSTHWSLWSRDPRSSSLYCPCRTSPIAYSQWWTHSCAPEIAQPGSPGSRLLTSLQYLCNINPVLTGGNVHGIEKLNRGWVFSQTLLWHGAGVHKGLNPHRKAGIHNAVLMDVKHKVSFFDCVHPKLWRHCCSSRCVDNAQHECHTYQPAHPVSQTLDVSRLEPERAVLKIQMFVVCPCWPVILSDRAHTVFLLS
jgi:hypothetical protein